MKKTWMAVISLLIAALLLCGCITLPAAEPEQAQDSAPEAAETAEAPAEQEQGEETATAEEGFPVTLTDQIGRTVTIEKKPERIVSGYYISSSACIALGLKDRLSGVEEKIDKRPIYKLAAPELIGSVANVGSAKAFDLESCLAVEPDLVILPKKAKDYAKTLEEMGIPVLVVSPESHDQLTQMIQLIADASGAQEKAAELLEAYDRVENGLAALTAGLSDAERPVVYMCGNSSYLTTAPKDMYQASLIRTAGGINAGDVLEGDAWTDISYEQLLAMDPDVIFIPTNNMANGQPDYDAAAILGDANLSELKAVKNGTIYNMPAGYEAWDSPVPSGVLGMLYMTAKLHPELYGIEQFRADAQAFYRTFYGFEMDPSGIE